MTLPPDPNARGVNIQLSRTEVYWILGAILAGFLGLASLDYYGIKGDIKDIKQDVRDLAGSYREAITSGLKVQDLITKAPSLEKTINETHATVIRLQDSMELLKPLPQQTKKIETNQEKMQIQLDNIQKQVHEKK